MIELCCGGYYFEVARFCVVLRFGVGSCRMGSVMTMSWQTRDGVVPSDPLLLPSLVWYLGTEFSVPIKSFGDKVNSGI